MMRRSSGIKSDIEKIKKLRALQEKATDKLNKISEKAASKARKKKTAKAAGKPKEKAAVKKSSFWQKLVGKKSQKVKSVKTLKPGKKVAGKKNPLTFYSSPSRGEGKRKNSSSKEGFIFRHFGRG
jgi:hypothetical protein